jgi:uncharacterized repeat protein (TIGR03803 family)
MSKLGSIYLRHSISAFAMLPLLVAGRATAQSPEFAIYTFAGAPDCGNLAAAAMISDSAGNLFGTTFDGGVNVKGCVFELSRSGNVWKETVLYSFSGADGYYPGAGLVFDKLGNLYGTTVRGGLYDAGVVFELSPSAGGSWTETVLHSFGSGVDGSAPESTLVFDKSGNLYGTTSSSGGNRRGGVVFELSPGQGGWTETILYSFPTSLSGPDGSVPAGGVVIDRKGRIYGNTTYGGAGGSGAVFELVPSGGGRYKESLIHSFDITDGLNPGSGLAMDSKGNLYGTTTFGGNVSVCQYVGCGTVFELAADTQGNWTESVLLALSFGDGGDTVGPVALDRRGNVYAVARTGGANGQGSVIELTPGGNGSWAETILHSFHYTFPYGDDGQFPYAGVTVSRGKVFGTTSSGGAYDNGIVFEMNPAN